MLTISDAVRARFESKIDRQPNGCWSWRGTDSNSQLLFTVRHGQQVNPRKFARLLTGEGVPEGSRLRAACGNRKCVSPEHAYVPRSREHLTKRSRVSQETGCWEWQGSVNEWGYGTMGGDGGGSVQAHRVSFAVFNGYVPRGSCVCHRCDNPRCVNPEHLFLGTNSDNVADKVEKKRQARGETRGDRYARGARHGAATHPESFVGSGNGRAKLTEDDVRRLRAMAPALSVSELARNFGITRGVASKIVRRELWKHVA